MKGVACRLLIFLAPPLLPLFAPFPFDHTVRKYVSGTRDGRRRPFPPKARYGIPPLARTHANRRKREAWPYKDANGETRGERKKERRKERCRINIKAPRAIFALLIFHHFFPAYKSRLKISSMLFLFRFDPGSGCLSPFFRPFFCFSFLFSRAEFP